MNSTHGGDIEGYRRQYGHMPLDFSASLNPLGTPPAVTQAAKEAVDNAWAYPDPHARQLTEALAQKLGVPPGFVLAGGGSADLIYRFVWALRPKRALLPVPSFAEYGKALAAASCEVAEYPLQAQNGFAPTEAILDAICPGVDTVFLCQPGNPTGQPWPPALLRRVLEKCGQVGARLFLDECFVPFMNTPDAVSLRAELAANPHLLILGSFTKLYGMAGIRLGWGLCGDAVFLAGVQSCGQPWGISTVAQAAGLAALQQDNYVQKSLAAIAAEKQWLREELGALGIEAMGAANYLFFYTAREDLPRLLAQQGILIRDCRNFSGLGPGYCRIAVRLRAENKRLMEAMAGILLAGKGGIT